MTDEQSALIDQLRIKRTPKPKRGRSKLPWIMLLLLLLAAAGGGYWWWQNNETGVPVTTANARALPSSNQPSAGASMLDASGYVVAHRQATVASLLAGWVAALPIEEGEQVTQGQILAQLDDRDQQAAKIQAQASVAQAQAALSQAQATLADAAPIFNRQRQEETRGLISAEAFETARSSYDTARTSVSVEQAALDTARANLASAENQLSETIIRSPFAGVVTATNVQVGEIISPFGTGSFTRSGIATLVDMNSLEAQVDVSETYINRVSEGQKVTVTLNAYPDWQIPGQVTAVIPTADETTATVKVRIALGVKDTRILPQMGLHASFLAAASAAGVAAEGAVIERDAVQTGASGDGGTVYVVDDDHVDARSVKLGAHSGSDQIILSGLSPGETVAVGDLSTLSDGAKIRVTR